MRQPDFIIKIAADSVQQLRRSDVERVFDTCSDEELKPTAAYITAARPDLASKVEQELDYQYEERGTAPTTDTINGYDYKHQAWVMNGVYLDCHHTNESCGCYGRTHKGQPVAADAEVR